MFKKIFGATFIAAALASASQAQQASAPDTMIVLDVSNSMWGQIDGVPKYEIARNVISDMVQSLDIASSYGLVAYGHRRKNDCTDIELLLPVGPLNPDTFSNAVNQLVPKGRTPLTEAVRSAAEIMNYSTRATRIILVSDGLESCDADPCALATELEAAGLDFTTHVIGFDVSGIEDQSQLSCLADNTGGLYITADSTEELMAAFEEVAQPAPPPTLTLVAVDTQGIQISDGNILWSIEDMTDGNMLLDGESGSSISVEYQASDYRAIAKLGKREGALTFYFDGTENARFAVTLPPDVSLSAPEEVTALTGFDVIWEGPGRETDRLVIRQADGNAEPEMAVNAALSGSPATFTAPAEAGVYDILYLDRDGDILGSINITVITPVTLDAPAEAVAGSEIDVSWVGPNNRNDYITIVPIGSDEGSYDNYSYTREGVPLALRTADQPGAFEIRYISGQSKNTLARRPITLTESLVALDAPAEAVAGSEIDVSWVGPDNRNDYITIVPIGSDEGSYDNYSYTREGVPLALRTADQPGAFEIRYISGQSKKTLARRPITLTESLVFIDAPAEAVAGSLIELQWFGPDNRNDYINITPVGAPDPTRGNYTYTRAGSPLELLTADEAGDYVISYISGQSKDVLAQAAITLTATEVSLDAPAWTVAGADIEVEWTGPDNRNDYISIVPAGAPSDGRGNYTYTREGAPLGLQTIDQMGDFELRYISGQSRTVLASRAITLLPPEISLQAAPVGFVGSNVSVEWIGPDNRNDYITIVPVGAKEDARGDYDYTRRGSPVEIDVPEEAGDYEIRYISGQSRTSLASIELNVVAE